MNKYNILVIDDDESIRELISELLNNNGYENQLASNAREGEDKLNSNQFHLILLDVMMPGENGISFCRRVREKYNIPIIIISAVDSEVEQILAHEHGADDYIVKPFNTHLLLAKIKRALNRYQGELSSEEKEHTTGCFGDWIVDLSNRYLKKDSNRIDLSTLEFNMLVTLMKNVNKPLSRDQLMQKIHGRDCDAFDRSIDVAISRLRKKLEKDRNKPEIIKTLHGQGYIFTQNVLWKE
ncbi:response regulator transcription factor [Francisellaceae bacterium]|nr:response regulator transcription factor [Francisellaceae bacterium]